MQTNIFEKISNDYDTSTGLEVEKVAKTVGFITNLEDIYATYEIKGNENFIVGSNKVEIVVTTKSGESQSYIVNAIRQISSNNYLKNLKVSEGELTPEFNKYELSYTVQVESEIEKITIKAEPEDTLSAITGLGDYTLEKGNNIIKIKVLSASNVERVYQVNVIRKYSEDNLLANLTISEGELNPKFDPYTNEYNVTLSSDVETVNIEALAQSEYASVSGTGEKVLTSGENKIEIQVASESGEINTYVIIVTRELSNDVSLLEFKSDTGVLDKEYSDEINEYTLEVDSNTTVINMTVTPTDNKTKVNGDKLIVINEIKTTIEYEIIAEDGTTRKITLTINKEEKIVDIILEKNNFVLVESEEEQIVASVSPNDIETEIIYEVEDTEVISVSNTGKISALKKGYTKVKVYPQKDPTIIKEIIVEVLSKEITSSIYEINREETKYIIGMDEGTTLEEFISNLENESSTIKIYDKEGKELQDMNDVVKTGQTVKLVINEKEYDSLIIIVRGDINEDGLVDVSDKVSLLNHILLKNEITDYRIYACDVEKDDIVDVSDKVKLVNYILRKISTLN